MWKCVVDQTHNIKRKNMSETVLPLRAVLSIIAFGCSDKCVTKPSCSHSVWLKLNVAGHHHEFCLQMPSSEILRLHHARRLTFKRKDAEAPLMRSVWRNPQHGESMRQRHLAKEPFVLHELKRRWDGPTQYEKVTLTYDERPFCPMRTIVDVLRDDVEDVRVHYERVKDELKFWENVLGQQP